ncbi:probable palmitoyltransferase ZDHHC19 isoform X1 [Monodon monoceros]|uniref:probable palmitoyltransferase ZDHHC19 isoform X1 n=1 Tax=Monodon monoceros TaxID=40151 RepID=UPI0010F521A5|nr:probable palmitoyltransferase ZDHHC19 isoform X1 [Monodon monoceros]
MGGPAMPLLKEPHSPPQAPPHWILPSLFAAFNVVLLVVFSGLFFAFPCRWLAQDGQWAFPIITGLLFILTFFSLVSLNFSDPGILHQGSNEQGSTMVHVVWVNHRAFRLQWCHKCCFHRPPRTYHCPWCNICVEDFDHHCKWVNNCIGHRNFRFFMLLILSLCLYSGAMLVTCLIFLVRTTHLPFSMDKAIAIVVAVPAAGFLVPLFLLLLIQAMSVSAAERSYEGKCRYLEGHNPFDHGCASNWYLTICAPLGPKYMAEAVWLQRAVGPDWVPRQNPHFPMCPSTLSPPDLPGPGSGPQSQPLGLDQPGKGPPGSGESAALQEVRSVCACACLCVCAACMCACVCWEGASADCTGVGRSPPVLGWP